MDKFIFLLAFIFSNLFGQSIELKHEYVEKDGNINFPIFIYDVNDLQSLDIHLDYDHNVIQFSELIIDPIGLLSNSYSLITNFPSSGKINIALTELSENDFNGMIAYIEFNVLGQIGSVADIGFNLEPPIYGAKINGVDCPESQLVTGSIEVVLDNLIITASDINGIGSEDFITLGMCSGCIDNWKYGEDEYDTPNPPDEFTNIYFYHAEWFGQADINDNINVQTNFSSDFRKQHGFNELIAWPIAIETSGILSEVDILLSWDNSQLINTLDNFNIYLYVGNEKYNMKNLSNVTISQSSINLNEDGNANIFIRLGVCASEYDSASNYYFDADGDGLGSDITALYCNDFLPNNFWVENSNDTDDSCPDLCGNNQDNTCLDNCGICRYENEENWDATLDCAGVCNGLAIEDACGVCGGVGPPCIDCNDNLDIDCNGICGGGAQVDICGVCDGNGIQDDKCDCQGNEVDCSGLCGGNAVLDSFGYCCISQDNIDCEGRCNGSAKPDCSGICGGSLIYDCTYDATLSNEENLDSCGGLAYIDNCNQCILDGETSDCVQDCNGNWGGEDNIPFTGDEIKIDACGVCGGNIENESECDTCDGIIDCTGLCNGEAYIDPNCNVCVDGNSGQSACEQDCVGVWGGLANQDECGICDIDIDNDNLCFDCNNVKNGNAYLDNCGNCIGDNVELSYECSIDCVGVWGGTYLPSWQCENEIFVCTPRDCNFLNNEDYIFPNQFKIDKVYPNPFNPITSIEYEISEAGNIKLEIYNLVGQQVDVLVDQYKLPGHYVNKWDANSFPTGIYFIVLSSNYNVNMEKIILLK